MTKFVGKFRKNSNYDDDYSYEQIKKPRNEHAEIKKILAQHEEELMEEEFNGLEDLHWKSNG